MPDLTPNQTRVYAAVRAAALADEALPTVAEIAADLSLRPPTVRNALHALRRRGLVKVVGVALLGGRTWGLDQ